MPQRGNTDIRRLIRNADVNIIISKILTSMFIGAFGFIVFYPLTVQTHLADSERELMLASSLSAFLASVLFLISFMGLQVSTSFVSTRINRILNPLPLTGQDVSRILFICFARIFDVPLITAAIVFVAGYFLVGGSLVGGLVAFLAVVTAEAFALALTTGMSRFFYSKVASGGGRSRWKTLLRAVFMFVWILPTFGTYLAINFATQVTQSFASLAQNVSSMQFLGLVYPFSFGYLVSFLTFFAGTNQLALAFSALSSMVYVALGFYSLRWVIRTVARMGAEGTGAIRREVVRDTFVRPQASWLGIIRKDLRIASRTPSYASLFLLPAMQTVFLAMSFSSYGDADLSVTLGALTGISMVTLLLPPTMFAIEGQASTYTRSLPMKKNTLIFAKTALTTSTYVISLAALIIVTSFFRKDPTYILVYGMIHVLSIAVAVTLELAILADKFWKEGFAVGNLYSRLSTFILILLPGYAVAWTPIVAAFTALFVNSAMVPVVFFGCAFSEFAIIATTVVARNRSTRRKE